MQWIDKETKLEIVRNKESWEEVEDQQINRKNRGNGNKYRGKKVG